MQSKKNLAEDVGVNPSHVAEYYMATTFNEVNGKRSSDEEFYNKVKKLLIEHGEVSNAIGRLVDHDVYDKMNYDQKQRYMLDLSNRYLEALERFRKEKYYCLFHNQSPCPVGVVFFDYITIFPYSKNCIFFKITTFPFYYSIIDIFCIVPK